MTRPGRGPSDLPPVSGSVRNMSPWGAHRTPCSRRANIWPRPWAMASADLSSPRGRTQYPYAPLEPEPQSGSPPVCSAHVHCKYWTPCRAPNTPARIPCHAANPAGRACTLHLPVLCRPLLDRPIKPVNSPALVGTNSRMGISDANDRQPLGPFRPPPRTRTRGCSYGWRVLARSSRDCSVVLVGAWRPNWFF